MHKSLVWLSLFALGILLVTVGWQGRLGSLIAALITPAQLQDVEG